MNPLLPDAAFAEQLAIMLDGHRPSSVTRFSTGSRHYVYDVRFADGRSLVLRIGDRDAHKEMEGAVHLSRLLRPLGVPLPLLIAEDVGAELPWLALERLAGGDLGGIIDTLSEAQLGAIAAGVAEAQRIVGQTGSKGRYGYAVMPEQAPFRAWSEVVMASFERSQGRIAAAGLFDAASAKALEARLMGARGALDEIEATPFLHDTTTKNVIVSPEGVLSGIVDVDDLCFGDPRYPIALTEASLLARKRSCRYPALWLSHAGLDDDPLFRLYVTLFLFDLMSEHGQSFNGNQRPSDPTARAILLQAFEDSLQLLD